MEERYLTPSGTARNRREIFKAFESFMLPPGNTVILLYDGSKRMPTKARCGCQVCVEHSMAYLTSRSYSRQLCNYYTIICTMLLLRSFKDNYKKITLPSMVVLLVQWIRNSAFNQESGVRFPAGALFHKIKLKFKNS